MRRLLFCLISMAAVCSLSACSEAGSAGATGTPPRAHTASAAPTSPGAPWAREAANPDPNFDTGLTVQITASGFHPYTLIAPCCQPVVWRNLSGAPASVVFDHQVVNSGAIAPGGTWSFTPTNIQSITYHSDVNPAMTGQLQVTQTVEDQ